MKLFQDAQLGIFQKPVLLLFCYLTLLTAPEDVAIERAPLQLSHVVLIFAAVVQEHPGH